MRKSKFRTNKIESNSVGIIGVGFVGQACEIGFSQLEGTEVMVHDKYKPTMSLEEVVESCSILFICVPTPMREDGSCDTSIVEGVAKRIADLSPQTHKAIVIKSTVTPGTTDDLQSKYPNHSFFFNPEFLTEKKFIDDFLNQKLIVLGRTKGSWAATASLTALYKKFTANQNKPGKFMVTDAKTAELLKYTVNCFLATKVSFFNEINQICDSVGVQYDKLLRLLEQDARMGTSHLRVPGPDGQLGFSGACFPKDLQALIAFAHEHDVDPLVLESAWAKNLLVRDNHDWQNLAQVTGNYKTCAG